MTLPASTQEIVADSRSADLTSTTVACPWCATARVCQQLVDADGTDPARVPYACLTCGREFSTS